MQRYILRRLLMLLLVLLGVSFLSYATMRIVPGDVVMQRLAESPSVSAKDVTALRHELGLDRPLLVQYGSWLAGVVRGDLGRSLWTDEPVRDQIAKRLPVSLELALLSGLVSLTVGLTSGIISAIRQDSWIDYVVRLFTTLGLAIPAFALATLALVVLGVYWQWSPGVWYQPFTRDPAANLQQMFLPALLLGLSLSASIARMTRSAMLEVLRQDYIRTASAKGLRERTVIARHALKNAMPPVLTIVGLQFGFLLSGTVVIETIFSLPGLGRLMLDAVSHRDYTLLQGAVLLVATIYVLVNLAVDLAYAWLDPRIRYS